jgi:hypothetical protein
VRVFLVDPGDVDLAHIGVCGDLVLGEVVVDYVPETLIDQALLVQRHREPIVIPPMNCERAVLALMTLPTAKTPVMRGTRTSPVSSFTRASTKYAPNACIE